MNAGPAVEEFRLLGVRQCLTVGTDLAERIVDQALAGDWGYVCLSNAHTITEGWLHSSFRDVLDGASYVSIDSRVVEISARLLGHRYPAGVLYGSELLQHICELSENNEIEVGLFGGSEPMLRDLEAALTRMYPNLNIVAAVAPAFGTARDLARSDVVDGIRNSGARILLVGLGCPKQEEWMSLVSSEIDCVMVGLGAAFAFTAGEKTASPPLVRRSGLDWLWRLASEPRRLWRRYLVRNPIYLAGLSVALIARWAGVVLKPRPGRVQP